MWVLTAAIISIAMIVLTLIAGSHMFFTAAILSENYQRGRPPLNAWEENEEIPDDVIFNPVCFAYKDELIEARRWIKEHDLANYSVTSFDGLRLTAKLISPGKMKGIILMMHGFHSSALHDFSLAVKEYYRMGYACMMPYQRAHGDSEGKYIYYGTKEKYDVVTWCELIEKEFPGVPVILDGISMGATTVMMASGLALPSCVKGIVADCGFTSPKDIFKFSVRRKFKMSPFPFFYTTSLYAKIRAGFSMKCESTADALKNNRLPILIAHGKHDSIVPYEMSEINYETARAACDAAFFTVEEADHGMSYLKNREGYLEEVKKLLDKCVPAETENT